jgi:hypothetical protein
MKCAGLFFLSMAVALSVYGQQAPAAKKGPQPGQIRGPCAEDAAKLCKDVTPGQGRIIACLQGQPDKLTPECRNQVDRAQQRQQARDKKTGAKAGQKAPQAEAKKGPPAGTAKKAPALEAAKK